MEAIVLKYTSSEAFQMVREFYPNWKEKIDEGKEMLKRLERIYKTDVLGAYQRFLNAGCKPESSIVMMASLYWIRQEERDFNESMSAQVNVLQDEQLKYGEQFRANESSPFTSFEDKKILRSYYSKKQTELQLKIEELINSIEVFEPNVLVIQPKLFTE